MRYSHKHILSSTQISDNTRLPDYFFELLVQDKHYNQTACYRKQSTLFKQSVLGNFFTLKRWSQAVSISVGLPSNS
jgi:hypothetical protein